MPEKNRKCFTIGCVVSNAKERERKNYKPSLAIDTGSAIKGKNRADLFTGSGKDAENKAGMLKKKIAFVCFNSLY